MVNQKPWVWEVKFGYEWSDMQVSISKQIAT